MAPWGWVAVTYAALMASSALLRLSGRRRWVVFLACATYAALAASLSTSAWFEVQLVAPGLALLAGYWLSGPFFDRPQVGLERWLSDLDERIWTFIGGQMWLARAPRVLLEGLEAAYALDYVVVGGGALLLWPLGADAVSRYWTIVLAAELTCYAALPWVRTRPPRAIEPAGPLDGRVLTLRRLNLAVLHSASVQANTIPSGHVAGAVAASLAVMVYLPAVGAVLLAVSALISVAAFVGRYHYLVDVILGGLVALVAVRSV